MGSQEKNLKKVSVRYRYRNGTLVSVIHYTSYRNTVMHGENITVECNHNYELEGNVTQITCNNGTFDRMPKCEPARCKTLPAPPKNGMVVVSFLLDNF